MIKVNKINKYFNKNKSNEIHVINDITFEFPKKGLVCLFGPSGSGKTTLLNAICGLDSINNGEIIVDDTKISKYKANQWDELRNRKFGYIFQSYILFNELSVYDNLSFVLEMLNIPKEDMDERIEYALQAVGMEKYKKRLCKQLSGGQQQRIAIARALVKSPDIVFADEPTGNLDEKNSTIIMNIIKKISKETLVILVTHERRIADFYSDKIIELKDGQIVNVIDTNNSGELKLNDDHNIYLQELNSSEVENNQLSVKYFYESEVSEKINIKLIVNKGNIYISTDDRNVKLKMLSNESEIKIIDSKRPIITRDTLDEFDYHLEKIPHSSKRKHSVISFKKTLKLAFNTISNFGRRQKLFLSTFILATIMVIISFSNFGETYFIDESKFLTADKNLHLVEAKKGKSFTIEEAKDYFDVEQLYFSESKKLLNNINLLPRLYFYFFSQQNISIDLVSHSILPVSSDLNLIHGRLPSSDGEIVIDKWIIDNFVFKNELYKVAGGDFTYQQLLEVYYGNDYLFNTPNFNDERSVAKFKIVGISDTQSPVIYTTYTDYVLINLTYNYNPRNQIDKNLSANYYIRTLKDDQEVTLRNGVKITADKLVLKENEVILTSKILDLLPSTIILFNKDNEVYNVVGLVDDSPGNEYVYVKPNQLKDLEYKFIELDQKFSLYSPKVKENDIYKVVSTYKFFKSQYRAELNNSKGEMIFTSLILSAALLFLFFIIRSSLISRIYEVGVYRALGVKKLDVYKLFISEILLILIFTCLPTFIFMSILINKLNNEFPLFFYPWYVSIGSLLFMFLTSLIVGILPVRSLLRLTPAQILNKYDI